MQHLRAGNELIDQDAFEPALGEYRAAYALCKSDKLFFSFGSCEQELGLVSAAAQHFERFLHDAPEAEQALRIEASLALRKLQPRLLVVELHGAPKDATVLVDGSPAEAPIPAVPIYLMPGTHTLRVRRAATATVFERTIAGAPGTHLLVDVPVAIVGDAGQPTTPLTGRWWFWTAIVATAAASAVTIFALTRPDRPSCDPPIRCP